MTGWGGVGVAVQVNHTNEAQVKAFFERVRNEQGRLDVLVNDLWGGDELTEWGKPFWELSTDKGFLLLQRAVHTHIITSRHGVPLMVERRSGLIVEVADGDFLGYHGNLFYDLAKSLTVRLAYSMAADLAMRQLDGVTALAVTPGFLRSEAMLDHFGVSEANWRDAIKTDRHFVESETPCFVGRAVAALADDPNVGEKAGQVLSSGGLAKEYGFKDVDGRQPDWGDYFDRTVAGILDRGGPADADERAFLEARYYQVHLDPMRAADAERMAAALGEGKALRPLRGLGVS